MDEVGAAQFTYFHRHRRHPPTILIHPYQPPHRSTAHPATRSNWCMAV